MRSSEKHENPWEFVSRREQRGKVHVSSCNQCNETFGEEKSLKDHVNNNTRSSPGICLATRAPDQKCTLQQSEWGTKQPKKPKQNKMAKQQNYTAGLGTKMENWKIITILDPSSCGV